MIPSEAVVCRSICFLIAAISLFAEDYQLGPDSIRHEGVPRGTITHSTFSAGKDLFPGTTREVWVYVPAQYKPTAPACLMVFQDGGSYVREDGEWRVPVVFDNLIHQGAMPVTIAVLVNPGVVAGSGAALPARFNRSYEYDSVNDRYARFLIEELLPGVAQRWNLSPDPDRRAIAGSSSGAIAAFTAATLRPDSFRRVLSFIGSYTDLRGGNVWPDLVRKLEPRPMRIFLQDGNRDLDIFAGSWWQANQDLVSALRFAGYTHRFVAGTEAHNGKHGGAILPDALRWLWQEWDRPLQVGTPARAGTSNTADFSQFADANSGWEPVAENLGFTEGPVRDPQGNVLFTDVKNGRIHRIDANTGRVSIYREGAAGASGLMFGPDGRLYVAENGNKRVVAIDAHGAEQTVADQVGSNDLCVSSRGRIYFTDPSSKTVWLVEPGGQRRAVYQGLTFPNGVRLSPDERMLMVADSTSQYVWSFQVQADGSLANGEPFYRLELPLSSEPGAANAWPDGLAFDTQGYLYVATNSGVQVCDQLGRVVAVMRKPSAANPSNLVFAGPDFQTLYLTAGHEVFRRRMRHQGFAPGRPLPLPKPQL